MVVFVFREGDGISREQRHPSTRSSGRKTSLEECPAAPRTLEARPWRMHGDLLFQLNISLLGPIRTPSETGVRRWSSQGCAKNRPPGRARDLVTNDPRLAGHLI